jgi:hypothetical protein
MEELVKLFTHETIVHSQIASIEKVLDRRVDFQITINAKETRSNIQFNATRDEMELIKTQLGYNLLVRNEAGWLPLI